MASYSQSKQQGLLDTLAEVRSVNFALPETAKVGEEYIIDGELYVFLGLDSITQKPKYKRVVLNESPRITFNWFQGINANSMPSEASPVSVLDRGFTHVLVVTGIGVSECNLVFETPASTNISQRPFASGAPVTANICEFYDYKPNCIFTIVPTNTGIITVTAEDIVTTTGETISATAQISIQDINTPAGQVVYTGQINSSFTVPQGITEISAVAVGSGGNSVRLGTRNYFYGGGGGALSYSSSIPVTAGEILTISSNTSGYGIRRGSTWLLYAENGGTASISGNGASDIPGGQASNGIGDVKYSGGNGGHHLDVGFTGGQSAGGGAASYTSNGGNSGEVSTTTRTGGGVSSREGGSSFFPSGGYDGPLTYNIITDPPASGSLAGGGVGLQGTTLSNDDVGIKGGGVYGGQSGSRRWSYYSQNSQNPWVFNGEYATNPYNYGGGRGIFDTEQRGGAGFWGDAGSSYPYNGAVRIIWGSGRSYPDNAEDA